MIAGIVLAVIVAILLPLYYRLLGRHLKDNPEKMVIQGVITNKFTRIYYTPSENTMRKSV